eukprot:SAG31_NODE_1158_length_9605_cov_2.788555_10_plen_59_part_00
MQKVPPCREADAAREMEAAGPLFGELVPSGDPQWYQVSHGRRQPPPPRHFAGVAPPAR